MSDKWWKKRVFYQVYPMSFKDSDGDGTGDIRGITEKLTYLKELGIGALWLSPVYSSPMYDNGYDISNYKKVNPLFGDNNEIYTLLERAAELDIKIVMDMVLNHTSDEHEWFQKSRRRIEPYTDFYIWRKAGENGKLPNNWGNFFGGKSWTYDELRGEYYLHLFNEHQPDLNYRNEILISKIIEMLKFWLKKGVSGFRLDVINILWKQSLSDGKPRAALTGMEHYISVSGLHVLLKRFRSEVFKDCYTVGETVFVDTERAKDLTLESRAELDTVFSFEHMESDCFFVKWFMRPFSPTRFLNILAKWQRALPWNTLYFENHDQPRSVSRFIKKGFENEGAKALSILLLSLKGTPYIYQGQEIGMRNYPFSSIEEVKDVESRSIWEFSRKLHIPKFYMKKAIKKSSRANARSPMQWSGGEGGGFSASADTCFPVCPDHVEINVEAEEKNPDSVLNFYKKLIHIRNHSEVLKSGEIKIISVRKGVIYYIRDYCGERIAAAVNLSSRKRKIDFSIDNIISNYGKRKTENILQPYEAAIGRPE